MGKILNEKKHVGVEGVLGGRVGRLGNHSINHVGTLIGLPCFPDQLFSELSISYFHALFLFTQTWPTVSASRW